MAKLTRSLAVLALCSLGIGNSFAESWKFVSIPDLINYDVGTIRGLPTDDGGPDSSTPQFEKLLSDILDAIKAENPDFVLVPGDLVMGHWERDSDNRRIFGPVGTLTEKRAAINAAADHYYRIWKKRFEDRGLAVHVALGDHEIGDNNWTLTDPKSQLVGDFKAAFARNFTKVADLPRYPERPLGTVFQDTAYAFKHRGSLFVTVDVFQQEQPLRNSGQPSGTVIASVSGGQLEWLRRVLLDANDDETIQHIFVQGHTPCLGPVRQRNSSGMIMLDANGAAGENTALWRTLEAARVDAYLCGEVHDITSSQLGEIHQIAHGRLVGQDSAAYMVVTVSENKIEYVVKEIPVTYGGQKMWQTYRNRPMGDGVISATNLAVGFREIGRMVVDKSRGSRAITQRTGVMLNAGSRSRELVVHLPFESVVGGISPNMGSFGTTNRSGLVDGAKLETGVLGKAMSLPNTTSRLDSGLTPIHASAPRTISTWVKLPPRTGRRTILSLGLKGDTTQWELIAEAETGNLALSCGPSRIARTSGPPITDGQWHHVACTHDPSRPKAVTLYVDGEPLEIISDNIQTSISYNGRLLIGQSLDDTQIAPMLGHLDDLAIWQDSFQDKEIRAIRELGLKLGYDAGVCDKLLTAYRNATYFTTPDGKRWHYYGRGLEGTAGLPQQSGINWLLPLGGGTGMSTQAPNETSLWQHFPFDTVDSSGISMDQGASGSQALFQGAQIESGRVKSSVRLAGNAQRVLIGNPQRNTDTPHTLSFWIRDEGNVDESTILSMGAPGTESSFRWVSRNDRQIGFRIGNVSLDSFVWKDLEPRWHLWTWIQRPLDATPRKWEFYLDGQKTGMDSNGASPPPGGNSWPLSLGLSSLDQNGTGFIGKIDDYTLWDRPLSVGQVRALHQLALHANMNAGECTQLFQAFDSAQAVTIQGRLWQPVVGVFNSVEGTLSNLPDGRIGICLSAEHGMATEVWNSPRPSVLNFSIKRQSPTPLVSIRWNGKLGNLYRVTASNDLQNWDDILASDLPFTGQPLEVQIADPTLMNQYKRFYRVEVE